MKILKIIAESYGKNDFIESALSKISSYLSSLTVILISVLPIKNNTSFHILAFYKSWFNFNLIFLFLTILFILSSIFFNNSIIGLIYLD